MQPKIDYLNGKLLYGDDFSPSEIKNWYEREKEGYADLGARNRDAYRYIYHNVNTIHGYSHLPKDRIFKRALGLGSAYGDEFLPVIDRIKELHIVEPSLNLRSELVDKVAPIYHDPDEHGKLIFPDSNFDLITCFSTLHHIPNVSFVFSELCRCLQPGGFLLIKEPITSMGDWRVPRPGLTANERGIPIQHFRDLVRINKMNVVSENLCLSMTPFLKRVLKKDLYKSRLYLHLDKQLSRLLKFRAGKYHRTNFFSKIAPGSVFLVMTK